MTARWNATIANAEADEAETLTDEHLMQRAQRRPDEFRSVFERYAREIERYFLSRLGGQLDIAGEARIFSKDWWGRRLDKQSWDREAGNALVIFPKRLFRHIVTSGL